MSQGRKWQGKSTYRLDNALRESGNASRALSVVQQSLRATIDAANLAAARQIVHLMESDTEPEDLKLGGWPCPESPTGACVYNDKEDPMHDDCLFCHDPSERK